MGEQADSSIELVKLVNQPTVPVFKLRSLSDHPGSNWIETPLLNPDHPVELSAEFIFETLKYFIDSGQRLSQMTKTYDDIDAVTRLLEEKERDLELAARIGQSLLEQNNELKNRVEVLESDLVLANDTVIQLKHELANKNGLIQMYSEFESDEPDLPQARDKTSLLINWKSLHEKIVRLEEENVSLRREVSCTNKEIDIEEKRELLLIRDCAKQLTDANLQLINLQEELSKRNDDSISQQEEITQLLSQAVDLQRRCRELSAEKEALETALQVSHECQAELSQELLDVKDKYELLLRAYHELQEELRRSRQLTPPNIFPLDQDGDYVNRQSMGCMNFLPFSESLAAEIESSLGSEGYESELSSLNTFGASNHMLNLSGHHPMGVHRRSNGAGRPEVDERSFDSPQPIKFNDGLGLMARNKLKIVKSFEGSQTLRKWKQLATPHLGVILENHSGVQSKTLKGIDHDLMQIALEAHAPSHPNQTPPTTSDAEPTKSDSEAVESDMVGKLFQPTSSIYTLTTTSLSQCKEVTIVTPSFASLQLATGHTPPLTSVAPTNSSVSINQINVTTNSDFATISISNSEPSSSSLTNYLTNILRNTSSYLSSRSSSSKVTTTVATPTKSNECQLTHCVSTCSTTSVIVQPSCSGIDSKSTPTERPKHLPIVSQLAASNVDIKSPGNFRSPIKAPSSGLAMLNTNLGPSRVLMRGNITGPARIKSASELDTTGSDTNKPKTTITYMSGLNALLINSSVGSASPTSDKDYVGKLSTVKTLRKGGLV